MPETVNTDTAMDAEEEAVGIIDEPLGHDHGQAEQAVADQGDAELYFLIAHALSGGPLAHLGETLVEEASARGLLPARTDYTGQRHSVPYTHLRDRYSHLSQGALRQGLQDLLQYRRAELHSFSGRNVSSILDPAVLPGPSALSSISTFNSRPPLWTLPPFSTKRSGRGLPRPNLAFLLETGIASGSSGGLGGHELLSPPAYSQLLQHHFTVRGHVHVIYCVMFDKTGSYLITGSDDRLVKIWSVGTGLLKCTCRGHDGEISDLSVSCDNSMFASASIDSSIRVWRLLSQTLPASTAAARLSSADLNTTTPTTSPHQLGTPISVLQGHTEAISSIDFSPNQPHILVSSSFDGTARVWDVRDGAIAPLILYSQGAGMGPGGGGGLSLPQTMLGGAPLAAAGAGAGAGAGRTTRHSERRQTVIRLTGAGVGANGSDQRQETRATPPAPPVSSGTYEAEVAAAAAARAATAVDTTAAAAEADVPAADASNALLTASFTKDGRYIVSGSNDCCLYVWRWPKLAAAAAAADSEQPAEVNDEGPSTSKAATVSLPSTAAAEASPSTSWPRIDPPVKLEGHRNDAWLTQHSNNGDYFASGSKDGTVRVWRRPRSRRGRGASWHLEATCACPVEAEIQTLASIAVNRRMPRQQAPPRVDQLVFTCDDRYLASSMGDNRVHVFSIPDGKRIHSLKGNFNEPMHILLAHPKYPSIVISASYSGETVIWDVVQGIALRTFNSKDTRPGGRDWPEGIPLVDGFINSDGSEFSLTDAAGQMHVYGLGPRCELTYRAPYDQFLSTDYEPLMRDIHGNVISAATQLPAHILSGRELLADATDAPYPLPFQEAYRNGKLLQVSEAEASCIEPGKQPGYMLAPPVLEVAAWQVRNSGGSEISAQNAVARAIARLADHENAYDRAQAAAAAAAAGGGRGGRGAGGTRTAAAAAANVVYIDDDSDDAGILSSGDEYDEDFNENEAGGGSRRSRRGRQLRREQPARQSSRILSQRGASQQPHGDASTRPRNYMQRQREEREERYRRRNEALMASLEQERQRHRRQRQARAAGARTTRAAARTTRRVGGNEDDEDAFVVGDSSEDDGGGHHHHDEDELVDEDMYDIEEDDEDYSQDDDEEYGTRGGRRRNRMNSDDEEEYKDTEDEDEGGGGGGGRSTRRRTAGGGDARRRKRGRSTGGQRDSKRRRHETAAAAATAHQLGPSRRLANAASPRESSAYAWLAGAEYRPGFYIPQAGDQVVYLREGHASVLASTSDKRAPPWQTIHRGRLMRPAEPCTVTSIHYSLAQDGTDATAVQACLELSDPASPLHQQTFTVDILPPSSGQAEFVILQSRFEQAVAVPWTVGDRCVSYWQTGSTAGSDGAGGEWWIGTILADTRENGAVDVAEDIYGCGGLWERWQVTWQGPIDNEGNLIPQAAAAAEEEHAPAPQENDAVTGDENPENATDEVIGAEQAILNNTTAATATATEDISPHSPWEIFQWETIRDAPIPPNTSRLDDATCTRLASAIETAAQQDAWTIFQASPEWNESYRSLNGRQEYYNRRIPLPLGLMDIVTRLHLRYYRQKEALQHDIRTISENAAIFNGPSSDISADARSLARYLLAVADAEELDQVNVAEYLAHEEGGTGAGGGENGHQDGWDVLEQEDEEDEEEEEEEEEERAMAAQLRRNHGSGGANSRRPAWYEGAAAFHQPEEERPGRSSRRPTSHGGGGGASGSGGGRRSSRAPQRINYREMLEDGAIIEERPQQDTTAIVPPQHMYSTRRAQAADEAAAVAAVAEAEAAEAVRQRQRMTIRLGRLNDI